METKRLQRVELHCHTNMSQRAGLYEVSDIINNALDKDVKSIAITDIDSIQAFSDAYKASTDYKVIYGLEIHVEIDSDPFPVVLLIQNETGRKHLYKLLSEANIKYYKDMPLIPKEVLDKYREGIIVGSAGAKGILYQAFLNNDSDRAYHIAKWFDYLEVVPSYAVIGAVPDEQMSPDDKKEVIKNVSSKIVTLGEQLSIPVCAASDSYYLEKSDVELFKILRHDYVDYRKDCYMYLLSTEEMLSEFSWLDEEKAINIVVNNTQIIADKIEVISPLSSKKFIPEIDGKEIEKLSAMVYCSAHKKYGEDNLPDYVSSRLDEEMEIISNNVFLSFYVALNQVEYSKSKGYPVMSRGDVAASLVAYFLGITETNPLPAHYYCPDDSYFELVEAPNNTPTDLICRNLPDRVCPRCGKTMYKDGCHITSETFFGKDGKIDSVLAYSGEIYQDIVNYTSNLIEQGKLCHIGTISTISPRLAHIIVEDFCNSSSDDSSAISDEEMDRFTKQLDGIKRDSGTYPGRYVFIPSDDVYEFTPLELCIEGNIESGIKTHLDYHVLKDSLYVIDILGYGSQPIPNSL